MKPSTLQYTALGRNLKSVFLLRFVPTREVPGTYYLLVLEPVLRPRTALYCGDE